MANWPNVDEIPTREKYLLTPTEFYGELGGAVGRNRILTLLKKGRIRALRTGNRWLIPRDELTAWPEREIAEQQGEAA